MDKKSSKFIPLPQQHIDPYQLISILNKKLKTQTESIDWYKKMYETAQYEKKITLNELKKKKLLIENLKLQWDTEKQHRKDYELELEQLRSKLNKIQRLGLTTLNNNRSPSIGQKQSLTLSPYSNNLSKQYLSTVLRSKNMQQKPISQLSLELKHSQVFNFMNPQPMSRVLQQKNINNHIQEFVPCDIKLVERQKMHKNSFCAGSSQSFLNMSGELMNQGVDEPINQKPGEFFIEDFLVFGPDVSELKKKRDQNRNALELQVKPAVLYAGNSHGHTQHVYTQIAVRCFPFGSKVKRQFIESYQQLKDIIQHIPANKLSKQCVILNLKGQPSQNARNSKTFKRSNLSQIEYIICVRVPDFVWLTKDQRHYQRVEQQVWMVEKYYAIVSYYPIIDVHLNIVGKIHSLLMKEKLKKILIEKEKFYAFDIRKNMLELEKNQEIKTIVAHFKSYQPQLGQVLFFNNHYYGTFPPQGEAEYHVLKLVAPIFMSTFSFEEMLLLLIGLFCQKSIALMSKDEGVATMCGLFLINILAPFPYSFSVLLNVDQPKIPAFIFQYPFPMISSIKKTSENLHQILESYASARIQKKSIKEEAQKMILVDIDTNSIFYQGHQTFQPLIAMSRPSDQLMHEYMKVNPSYSKSYSFPKKMDQKKEAQQVNKRNQEKNKIIEDMQHTIKSHVTKIPCFEMTAQIHKTLMMLIRYVRSFAIDGRDLAEAVEQLRNGKYHEVLRRALLQRHPNKAQLVEKIVNSQYYADYLNLYAEE